MAWSGPATLAATQTVRDVQRVGLPFMYEALFAASNCPNVALDQTAFARAARLYHLAPDDFTPGGPFGPAISALDAHDRIRLEDDHVAFCSMSRLGFAVPHGILVDLGPALPRASIPILP